MKEHSSILRHCISCGEQKPLAMFLQLSGAQGTLYGSVCAPCRAKNSQHIEMENQEEASGGSTGLEINAKTKIQFEADRRDQEKKTKEINKEEAKSDLEAELTQEEKKESKLKAEKYHRQSFLETKRTFLNTTTTPPGANKTAEHQRVSLSEKQQATENQQRAEASDLEFKQTTTDFSAGISPDPQQGIRFQQGDTFKRLKDWLGMGANFRTAERHAMGNKARPPGAKTENKTATSDPMEFIEKNWKPGGGKKR